MVIILCIFLFLSFISHYLFSSWSFHIYSFLTLIHVFDLLASPYLLHTTLTTWPFFFFFLLYFIIDTSIVCYRVHWLTRLFCTLHVIHEGIGFDHWILELSFPSFLSPYYPKPTLRFVSWNHPEAMRLNVIFNSL